MENSSDLPCDLYIYLFICMLHNLRAFTFDPLSLSLRFVIRNNGNLICTENEKNIALPYITNPVIAAFFVTCIFPPP